MAEAPIPSIIEPCLSCGQLIDVTDQPAFTEVTCPICGSAMRARKQFNNFMLLELLGEGGMGSVFKAVDLNLGRNVALKVLKREAGATESDWEKLAAEAKITASINHPHVVKVYSFGEDHGQFYLAMELVEKGSLDDLMHLQTRVAESQVLEVGIQIAEGLEAAYEKGLIHRDVKPGNILFADARTAKIVDFGLAILLDEAAHQRGEIWGTPYYIAPEKLDHQPEDFRSDMYSLGATLFHAIAGRPPFEAETASMVALKHIKSRAVSLEAFAPDVSGETAYVINRMLKKSPDERYQSYAELVSHLTYARQKLLDRAERPWRPRERVEIESQRTHVVIALIWMATLLVLVLAGVGAYLFRDMLFQRDSGLAPVVERAVLPGEEREAKMAQGREAMVEGRYENAAAAFASAAEATGEQPQRTWAKFNQGVALLLAGKTRDANGIFRELSQGPYTGESNAVPAHEFFTRLAEWMASEGGVSAEVVRAYSGTDHEAFAFFALGVKDWQLGDTENAGALLRRFVDSEPAPPDAWMAEYKGIAEPLMRNANQYGELAQKSKAVADGKEALEVIGEIRRAKRAPGMNPTVAAKLDALERELIPLTVGQP